ncbi:hypothetical protein LCGC14_2842720, partial [marine sediment metagenome]
MKIKTKLKIIACLILVLSVSIMATSYKFIILEPSKETVKVCSEITKIFTEDEIIILDSTERLTDKTTNLTFEVSKHTSKRINNTHHECCYC